MSDFRPDAHLNPGDARHTRFVAEAIVKRGIDAPAARFTFGGSYVQTPAAEGEQHRGERGSVGEAEGDLAPQDPGAGEQEPPRPFVPDTWRYDFLD